MFTPAISLLILFGTAFGQVIDYKDCPYTEVIQDFNVTAFLGTWYQYSRYWDYFQVGTRCNTATYSLNANGSIDVLDQNVYEATEKHQKIKGVANLLGNGTEGRLDFSYPPAKEAVGEYLILGTDYENWMTMWSCSGIPSAASVRFAFTYTREQNPSEEVINATVTALENFGIPTDILMTTDQEDCTV